MAVSGLGEFELIERLAAVLGQGERSALLRSIGDDAAIWRPTPGALTVATTDALVEDVHFTLATTSWRDLGWKAMAENVSDIAAMGCQPRYALIALGVPPSCQVADLEDLYRGIRECADVYAFAVVGGDVVRALCVTLHVTIVGESLPIDAAREAIPIPVAGESPPGGAADVVRRANEPGTSLPSVSGVGAVSGVGDRPVLERSSARAGDVVAVTGPLGGSAAGLRVLSCGEGTMAAHLALARAHRRPIPRVAAGLALVEAGVRCGIDVSDGLVADLGHICERSGVDAEIEITRVPLFPESEELFGEEAVDLALSGGEDYELVCAAPADTIDRANALLVQHNEPALVPIGMIVAQAGSRPEVRVRNPNGTQRHVSTGGYQHYGSGDR